MGLTAAQRARASEAERLLSDTLRGLTVEQAAATLALCVVSAFGPKNAEVIGNQINRAAWDAARRHAGEDTSA